MNLLQLVNLARTEAGVAGGDLTTVQGTISLEAARFRTWVVNAWNDIQTGSADWQFMRLPFEFDTVANQQSYTPQQAKATDDGTASGSPILGAWKRDSFRVSTTGANYGDEMLCGFMPYWQFRNLYQFGNMRAQRSRPVVFSIDPQKNLLFGITPDGQYRIVGEFYRTPVTLGADTDTPACPDRFHPLIAYKALRAYGIFMSAPEVIGRADERISQLEPMMYIDQMLPVESGPPLA